MTLTPVSVDMLPLAWQQVLPWIEGACARVPSGMSADELYGICEREEGALILIGVLGEAPIAAGVTQVRDHEDGTRVCWIAALGGEGARAWRDTLKIIEANARRIGCASVRFVGRPGWAGLLPEYRCHVEYEKVL